MTRIVTPLPEDFFNDGHRYVLTSASLGGCGLGTSAVASHLEAELETPIRGLVESGVCLPLFFDSDCAMDRAVVVRGQLSEAESSEWVGRLRSTLVIEQGEFLVMGGGTEDCFREAFSSASQDPFDLRYHWIPVPPGRYLVEVFAFVGSATVNAAWGRDYSQDDEDLSAARPRAVADYWDRTRPGQARPPWVRQLLDEGYVDGEDLGLIEYVIRLELSDEPVESPPLEENTKWCGIFEMRRPEGAPRGLQRSDEG